MNFDYGNVLTHTIQVTWRHKSFWLFMIVPVLISFIFFGLFAAPVFFLEENGEPNALLLVLWVGVLILGLIINVIASAAGIGSLSLGILRVERGEGSTAFMDLLRDGFQYFGRVFGVMLIVQLTVGAIFTIFFLLVAALTVVTMGIASICLQPAMILITPLSFLVVAVMNGGIVAIIDEGLGPWDAVKRALEVVREHVWKFVILTLIVYFGTSILAGFLVIPAMIPAMMAPVMMEVGEQAFMATIFLFICLFFPFMAIFSGLSGTFMTTAMEIAYLRLSRPAGSEVIFAPDDAKDATS